MDNLGAIFGLVAALVLGAYLRSRHPAKNRLGSVCQFALIIVIAAAADALGGLGGHYLRIAAGPSSGDVDKAMLAIRQQPLLGLVISESAAVESEVRKAAEAELANPTKGGPDRLWQLGANIRQRLIVPALRNAGEGSSSCPIRKRAPRRSSSIPPPRDSHHRREAFWRDTF